MFSNKRPAPHQTHRTNLTKALLQLGMRPILIMLAGTAALGACLLSVNFATARAESDVFLNAPTNLETRSVQPSGRLDNTIPFGGIFSSLASGNGRFSYTAAFVVTLVVTNTNDSGAGSLRQAILDSNATPGVTDTITFNIPGSGVRTIALLTGLPGLSDPVIIDGTSQPGFAGNPLIELNGTSATGANGLTLQAGNCVVRALAINRFPGRGIQVQGSGSTIQGNYIGTNALGTARLSNASIGIWVLSSNNLIGGTTVSNRNLISGNGSSGFENVRVEGSASSGNTIQGNIIGPDITGNTSLSIGGGGGTGVWLFNAPNNTVGGVVAGTRNLISGNGAHGLQISGSTATGNFVQGNSVGLNNAGNAALSNSGDGVVISGGATNNTIGGTTGGARNFISGNSGFNVNLLEAGTNNNTIQGNFIGPNVSGTGGVLNTFAGVAVSTSTANNTIGGTAAGAGNVISGNSSGIIVESASGTIIQGNLIGTDFTGTALLANSSSGVFLSNSSNSLVGGTVAGARNVISGSAQRGLAIGGTSTNNTVQGNYIGTNVSGTAAIKNGFVGLSIFAPASNNLIGGATTAAGNVISGNDIAGVTIESSGTPSGPAIGNRVQGNYIGVAADGIAPLGNTRGSQQGWGVLITRYAAGNLVGGTAAGEGNIIANNAGPGVGINTGSAPVGTTVGNSLLGNFIFNNFVSGIDLEAGGVDVNDLGDADGGANNRQNSPVLNSVTFGRGGSTVITGSLNSVANTTFRVELFSSPGCNNGEGSQFEGSVNVTTNGNGDAAINALASGNITGSFVTATATRLNGSGNPTDTSEFSACFGQPLGNTIKADYRFQGDLNSSVPGAPAMTNLTGSGGPNSFQTDLIDGYTRTTLRFPFNSGLAVSTAGLIPNNSYTIVLLFKFDAVTGFRRIVDFKNGTSDDGAYFLDGRYEGEPTTNPQIEAGTYVQGVVVRDESGAVRAYRDGILKYSATDVNNDTLISPANILRFFQDDLVACCEASAGNVARIRLYDAPMSTAQVQSLDRLPNAIGGGDQSVLLASNRDGNSEIYVMNADGTNQRRLTNNSVSDSNAKWSPDGQKMVFSRQVNGRDQIVVMNADGTGETALTDLTAIDHFPDWSPDGSKILFSRCDLSFVCDIYSMAPNGTNLTLLTPGSPDDDDLADWSPDGSKIAISEASATGAFASRIAQRNADGSNRVQLTNPSLPGLDLAPTYSRNGRKIAFTRSIDANVNNREIWVMDSNGTGQVQLTSNAAYDDIPIWSADGSSILFSSRRDNAVSDIYSMSPTGTGVVRLTRNSAGDTAWDVRPPASFGACQATPITYGDTISGALSSASCLVNTFNTDLYSFSGTAGDQIALSMESSVIFTKLELLNPQGTVIASAGDNVVRNSRIPVSGFFTLPATGAYTIRAATFAGSGGYTLSLFKQPTGGGGCAYQISPASTFVPATGGSFWFAVLTPPGCPPAGSASSSGGFFTFNLNVGRVNYTVSPNPGASSRQGSITVAGQTFTITQYGTAPPANDNVENAQCLVGSGCPPGPPVTGANGGASSQTNEPPIVPGNAPAHSVWYSFTPATGSSGLYSFTTSGSDFDTVMAVYQCPSGNPCTFAEMTLLGSNDNTTNFDTTSKVNFRATAGIRYMIAVDGRNGATGSIQLSWRQYEQLYRIYLQTYNGNPSPFVPDEIYASPNGGVTRILPDRVSLGVYEFNIPTDGLIYRVQINGPAALDIVWTLNNFVLNSTFQGRSRANDTAEMDPPPGTQNFVTYAANAQQHSVSGFIRNLTNADVGLLSVLMGSSNGPNPHALYACTTADAATVFPPDGLSYLRYQCVTQPDTLHDIIPSEPGKRFNVEVKSFNTVFNSDDDTPPGLAYFNATNAPTFTITGHAPGGAGTVIDLSYVPGGGASPVQLRLLTDAAGSFRFGNLPPRTYTLRAQRSGFLFNQPGPIVLNSDVNIEIMAAQNPCQYTATGLSILPASGGEAQFSIATSDPSCEWAASVPSTIPWLHIRSGSSIGPGTIFFAADSNNGPFREGTIRVGEQSFVVQQLGGSTNVQVTVQTLPAGRSFTVDGTNFTSGQTFNWIPGSQHTIATTSLQSGTIGTRYLFSSWSDGGALSHTIAAPQSGNATYTANFGTQHFLTMVSGNRGSASPSSNWFNEGQQVNIQATPNGSFRFGGWTGGGPGSYTGPNNPATVTISGPVYEAAAFSPTPFDFDGDGRADIVVRRPSDNNWYLLRTMAGYTVVAWGINGDIAAPADFDGDGKTDLAIFRPSTNTWHIFGTTRGIYTQSWGTVGDIPVPADYDGDGKADVAIYRPSTGTWWIIGSTAGLIMTNFGTAEDKPYPADYDGDGKADIAVRRPSENNWYLLRTTAGYTVVSWGINGDVADPADFDGDKKTDLAVFRSSTNTWYIFGSTRGQYAQTWGTTGDIPVAADYDGDGESDIAIWRPSDQKWYISGSRFGFIVTTFGEPGDVPAPSIFNY